MNFKIFSQSIKYRKFKKIKCNIFSCDRISKMSISLINKKKDQRFHNYRKITSLYKRKMKSEIEASFPLFLIKRRWIRIPVYKSRNLGSRIKKDDRQLILFLFFFFSNKRPLNAYSRIRIANARLSNATVLKFPITMTRNY